MLSKRKPKKLSSKYVAKATGQHELDCSVCFGNPRIVSTDVARFTCSYCVQQMVAPPENYNKKKDNEGFPRGWHFKKRFEGPDGKIYSFGKLLEEGDTEVSNDTEVAEVPPTKKRKTKQKSSTKKTTRRKGGKKSNNLEGSE